MKWVIKTDGCEPVRLEAPSASAALLAHVRPEMPATGRISADICIDGEILHVACWRLGRLYHVLPCREVQAA